ncbi:MAG: serine hydrolase [bacterium]|nr:serine hydrolase [bacterium]
MTRQNHILSLVFAVVVLVAVLVSGVEDSAPKDIAQTNPYTQTNTELVAAILPPPIILVNFAPQPQIASAGALMSDLSFSKDIFSLNLDQRWPLASLTKLITATVALEGLGGDYQITISESAVATEGLAGNFYIGEKFSVSDLVKAMMVTSSNDAATALAESFPGGRLAFVEAMSTKVAELHMTGTSLFGPSGLSLANQSTTPDIRKLVLYIYRFHPEIFKWSTQRTISITDTISGRKKTLNNINHFAGRSDFIGGKTGYLDESSGNLVSLFSSKGHIILIIVLGADDRFGETEKLWKYYKSLEF